jgi:carbamoylphosphate synthase large subunit
MLLKSLSHLGYTPIDVVVDKDGSWLHRGMKTDPHTIFMKTDGYVDTTHMHDSSHHDLASRMGIKNLYPHNPYIGEGDRESLYRVLRQQNIPVPKTVTIRSRIPPSTELLQDIWKTYHTPLYVRPLYKSDSNQAKIVRSFKNFMETISSCHVKKIDVHVFTYTDAKTYSIAVLPHYRNEELYTPLPVQTFVPKGVKPNSDLQIYPYNRGETQEKEDVVSLAQNVCRALNVHTPTCVDIIPTRDGYRVVNVDSNPSLTSSSRFMQSLATTGVDIGHYIQSRLFAH